MYEKEYDFLNCVNNLGFGWTNWFWYEDNKNKLLDMRDWAYQQKPVIKNLFNVDVEATYEQLEDFESLINKCDAACRREAIIITALAYAENRQPIISTGLSDSITSLLDGEEKKNDAEKYRFDVITDLLDYYLENYKNPAYFNVIQTVFPEYAELERGLNNGVYLSGRVIKYLKILLYYQDSSAAARAIKLYPITPATKKEIADYEKIKLKINIK